VPNGLFLSITLAYALGAVRIIKYGALVQQSNAIESLSNVTVLCTDKTGTLTANRLQVNAVHPIGMSEDELKRILGTMVSSARTLNKTSETIARYPAGRFLASTILLQAQMGAGDDDGIYAKARRRCCGLGEAGRTGHGVAAILARRRPPSGARDRASSGGGVTARSGR
jgi:magnesium-transporting ATPase (P-type)